MRYNETSRFCEFGLFLEQSHDRNVKPQVGYPCWETNAKSNKISREDHVPSDLHVQVRCRLIIETIRWWWSQAPTCRIGGCTSLIGLIGRIATHYITTSESVRYSPNPWKGRSYHYAKTQQHYKTHNNQQEKVTTSLLMDFTRCRIVLSLHSNKDAPANTTWNCKNQNERHRTIECHSEPPICYHPFIIHRC
jgi:hypothetical protein